ncbi:hypothetical protein ACFY8B_07595, partial [Streptomyces sp. NPDC012751]|uniref:hypothetical protein n=1 Tax=Streptomyces sp. NPDC012751 TaxID=3364846 RepID=UPI0036C08507
STYLALIFGTLLSSQGTVASFVLTLAGFPPGFPSFLRFRLYQIFSRSDFLGAFQVFAFAFPFPAVPTLSDPFGSDSRSAGFVCGLFGFRLRPFDVHYVSRFPRRLIIEPGEFEFRARGRAGNDPAEGLELSGGLAAPAAGDRRTRFSGSRYITHLREPRQLRRRLGT